jgi:uncharacterized membrane protein
MSETIARRERWPLNPVHAILVASTIPLFLGAVLSDWAYSSSYQVQWTNFASWLVAGGLLFTGLALAWAVIEALAHTAHRRRRWLYPALLLATFVIGFINALVHAKDAWAAMPAGFILSIVTLLLAIAANWAAYSAAPEGDRR